MPRDRESGLSTDEEAGTGWDDLAIDRRERESGWVLHRIALRDLSPVALGEHRAGWDLTPNGERFVLATGEALVVRPLAAGENDQ